MTKNENYIDRIKRLKSDKKITNEQLAEMTGIPLSTLSKILAGISDSPKLINVVAIAEALGCTLDYLVNGNREENNRYILTPEEVRLVEGYRKLDSFGKELTMLVVAKEKERAAAKTSESETDTHTSRVLPMPSLFSEEAAPVRTGKRLIRFYDLPVSAGVGIDLDEETATELQIPDNDQTRGADFALRISGNSMEPKFHDGDILLVRRAESAEIGDFGIFILDGAGYFKKFGGDCLISLNPAYAPIPLSAYSSIQCIGRVIGKMYRK